jgi:hypothetical protein
LLAGENEQLQQKLRRAHTELEAFKKGTAKVGVAVPPSTARQDRDFMEGAAWFGRNAVHITDRLSASVAQIISQLQMQRGSAEADDSGDAEMLLEDSLKQLSVCVRQCRDRMRRLFEGTLDDNIGNPDTSTLGSSAVSQRAGASKVDSTLRMENL